MAIIDPERLSPTSHSAMCMDCLQETFELPPGNKILILNGDMGWGIKEATNKGAGVISVSFSSNYDSPLGKIVYGYFERFSTWRAVNYAHSKDVVIVSAVGNDNSSSLDFLDLSRYDNVIAVAGTLAGKRWPSSNYGNFVDIAAPAVINTTYYYNDTYKVHVEGDGTSFSAPRVAGVVATLQQENPALRAVEITNILYNTADDKGPPGWDPYTGYGEVNLTAALQAVRSLPNLNSSERNVLLNQPVKSEKKINIKEYIRNGLFKIHKGLKHLVQKLT